MITLDRIAVVSARKPLKKRDNPDVLMAGVADLTAIGRVISDLETAEATVDQEIRAAAIRRFLADGCALKSRPSNFYGCEVEIVDDVELRHSVSVELRNHGSPLSAEAQALAEQYDVPVERVETVSATYVINPAYASDMTLMQRIVDALNVAVAKGELPADVLKRQEGQSKVVTSDRTLPAIFAMEPQIAEMLLPVFSVLAVGKGKCGALPGREDDLTPALDRTARLLNRPSFRAEMQATATKLKAKRKRAA